MWKDFDRNAWNDNQPVLLLIPSDNNSVVLLIIQKLILLNNLFKNRKIIFATLNGNNHINLAYNACMTNIVLAIIWFFQFWIYRLGFISTKWTQALIFLCKMYYRIIHAIPSPLCNMTNAQVANMVHIKSEMCGRMCRREWGVSHEL